MYSNNHSQDNVGDYLNQEGLLVASEFSIGEKDSRFIPSPKKKSVILNRKPSDQSLSLIGNVSHVASQSKAKSIYSRFSITTSNITASIKNFDEIVKGTYKSKLSSQEFVNQPLEESKSVEINFKAKEEVNNKVEEKNEAQNENREEE